MRILPQTLAPNEVRCPHVTSTLPVIKLLTVAVRSASTASERASDLVAGHRQEGAIAGTDNQPIQNHVFTTNWIFSAVVDVDKLPDSACLGNRASAKVSQNARLADSWPHCQNAAIAQQQTCSAKQLRSEHITSTLPVGKLPAVTAGSMIASSSSSHTDLFVQSLDEVTDYLSHSYLSPRGFTLQPLQLFITQAKSKNIFSSHICRSSVVECSHNVFNIAQKISQQLAGSGDGLVLSLIHI